MKHKNLAKKFIYRTDGIVLDDSSRRVQGLAKHFETKSDSDVNLLLRCVDSLQRGQTLADLYNLLAREKQEEHFREIGKRKVEKSPYSVEKLLEE